MKLSIRGSISYELQNQWVVVILIVFVITGCCMQNCQLCLPQARAARMWNLCVSARCACHPPQLEGPHLQGTCFRQQPGETLSEALHLITVVSLLALWEKPSEGAFAFCCTPLGSWICCDKEWVRTGICLLKDFVFSLNWCLPLKAFFFFWINYSDSKYQNIYW